jgi:hypothetical protein
MRIVKPQTAFAPGKNTKPVKREAYRKWIKTLPCMVCHSTPTDAAHLSMERRDRGALSRGLSSKASDRWCLPLCRSCHDAQHKEGEWHFWFATDPHLACLVIWGLWSDYGEDATDIVTELIVEDNLG